jgi:hypothetical protein
MAYYDEDYAYVIDRQTARNTTIPLIKLRLDVSEFKITYSYEDGKEASSLSYIEPDRLLRSTVIGETDLLVFADKVWEITDVDQDSFQLNFVPVTRADQYVYAYPRFVNYPDVAAAMVTRLNSDFENGNTLGLRCMHWSKTSGDKNLTAEFNSQDEYFPVPTDEWCDKLMSQHSEVGDAITWRISSFTSNAQIQLEFVKAQSGVTLLKDDRDDSLYNRMVEDLVISKADTEPRSVCVYNQTNGALLNRYFRQDDGTLNTTALPITAPSYITTGIVVDTTAEGYNERDAASTALPIQKNDTFTCTINRANAIDMLNDYSLRPNTTITIIWFDEIGNQTTLTGLITQTVVSNDTIELSCGVKARKLRLI